MKFLIQRLEGNGVLDLIGVPRIRFVPQLLDPTPYMVTMEGVRIFCDMGKKHEMLTDDEIATIKADCEALGVKPDFQAVVDAIKTVELPPELAGDYDFRLCTNVKCPPVPHGFVYKGDHEYGEVYHTVWQAFEMLFDLDEGITPAEVVHILKKMAALLPTDEAAQKVLIDALTPEQISKAMGLPEDIGDILGALLGFGGGEVKNVGSVRFRLLRL